MMTFLRTNPLGVYARWLHLRWPAGTVEKLPDVREDGSTAVPGLYVVGDLTGIPLLKFSADTGARVARLIAARAKSEPAGDGLDLVIIGAGISGMSAALEARKLGLKFQIIESAEPLSTIVNFPKAKPIYTYPHEMKPTGDMHFREEVHPKEALLEDIRQQTRGIEPKIAKVERVERAGDGLTVVLADQPPVKAKAVIVAIGRSGNFRRLNVPGEDLDKVYNRLHDPKEFRGKNVLVVGGGDSALEAAIAIAEAGAKVTLSYRKSEFSRPKPENVEKLARLAPAPPGGGSGKESAGDVTNSQSIRPGTLPKSGGVVDLRLGTTVGEIRGNEVDIVDSSKQKSTIPNDAVLALIGREPPLDFFRKSGVKIRGERSTTWWVTLILFLVFCVWMYHWKKGGVAITGIDSIDKALNVGNWWSEKGWFPYDLSGWLKSLGGVFSNVNNPLGTLRVSMGEPGFWYSLAYCACVVGFGIDRIQRRRTPYVTRQTLVLMSFQVIPLFLLPYLVLPWIGHLGAFSSGAGQWFADTFFPVATYTEHGREYWRAFGFILAWPLFIWNVFTSQPMWGWLIVSFVQTFVIIPIIIYFWGKGAYCGWVCSCGALAETLGDRHRQKMPHGPVWNRVNFVGQAFLAFAMVLMALRIAGWIWPGSQVDRAFAYLLHDLPLLNYVWFVDLFWAGILGVGMYFWFSGRVWCRFACPLAALMHIYARFSRFAIIPEKKKCISCNVCTSVCHQGIDIMNFANKGEPMIDPECVRCSACVQMCPTGVLEFGQIDIKTKATISKDRLQASPVLMREIGINGKMMKV